MALQGLNVLLLAAVAGGVGFVAKRLQEGRLQKPARTKQQEADTSSGGEDEDTEEGDEGEEADTDYSAEDAPLSSLQHAREEGPADESAVPADR